MLVGCEMQGNRLIMSHYNRDGKLAFEQISVPDSELYKWVPSTIETEFKTWDGSYIQKIAPGMKYPRFRIEEIMMKYAIGHIHEAVFSAYKPKAAYLDIENYVNPSTNEFTPADIAEFPINVLSILSEDTIFVLTTLPRLQPSDIEKMENELNGRFKEFGIITRYNIFYTYFPDEKMLLFNLINRMLPKLGLITGWNVIEYDWQYITNRCKTNGLDIMSGLPIKTTNGRFRLPNHLAVIDYIEAIEAFKPYNDLENNSLDVVAKRATGIGKLENPYNTFSEFIKDTYRFILYNIIDVCSNQQIEKNIKLLELSYAVGNISKIELAKIFSSVYMTEIYLCREFLNRGVHLPDKKINNKPVKYKGAYTECKRPGFYKYIVGFDFNSMYPNIDIEWNMGPDTYLGYADKIDPATLPSNFCRTAKNTIFDTTKPSAASVIFKNYYDQRCDIQAKKRMYEKAINAYECGVQ